MNRFVMSAAVSIGGLFLLLLSVSADDRPVTKSFAQNLCNAWNNSSLPKNLGSENAGGSGWIDVVTDVASVQSGSQIIATGRKNCSENPEFVLHIQKQPDGTARCTGSSLYGGKRTWQFLPETNQWKEYGNSFGMGAFYDLWKNGMKGNKGTAYSNRKHFQVFFKLASGLPGNYLSPGCAK